MATIDKIRERLDVFVLAKGNVDDLTNKDELYRYIKNSDVLDANGKRLSVDEKFALAGHPRTRKRAKSAEEALVEEVQAYLDNGGSFHVERKSLPFYPRLKTVVRTKKAELARDITYEEYMKSKGFKSYSDDYYRFARILDLQNYQDAEGYVDSYRKDAKMKDYIHNCAVSLGMPIPIVVSLIGDKNLSKNVLSVDYLFVTKLLNERHLYNQEGFRDLKSVAPEVYGKLAYIRDRAVADGAGLTTKQILEVLGFFGEDNGFKDYSLREDPNIENTMVRLRQKALAQDGKIYRKDIPDWEYRHILLNAVRQGCYMKAFFKLYDIDYVDGRDIDRFGRMVFEKIPFIDEMRKERDEVFCKVIAEVGKDICKEETFEIYLKVCKDVYKKYESKISFGSVSENQDCEKE